MSNINSSSIEDNNDSEISIADLMYDIFKLTKMIKTDKSMNNQYGGEKKQNPNTEFFSFKQLKSHVVHKLKISDSNAVKIAGSIIRNITKNNPKMTLKEVIKKTKIEFNNNLDKYKK